MHSDATSNYRKQQHTLTWRQNSSAIKKKCVLVMEFSGPTFFKFPTNTQTHSGTFAVCQAVQETCTFCVYECYSKNLNL